MKITLLVEFYKQFLEGLILVVVKTDSASGEGNDWVTCELAQLKISTFRSLGNLQSNFEE